MTAPQSSSSDPAWVPAPRDIGLDELAAARQAALRNATGHTEAALFLSMLGLEDAS